MINDDDSHQNGSSADLIYNNHLFRLLLVSRLLLSVLRINFIEKIKSFFILTVFNSSNRIKFIGWGK